MNIMDPINPIKPPLPQINPQWAPFLKGELMYKILEILGVYNTRLE